jgi:hypothetical protein
MKCSTCGTDYPSKYYFTTPLVCNNCYKKMTPMAQATARQKSSFETVEAEKLERSIAEPGRGLIDVLKFFAWLDLVAGIIVAVWIWSTSIGAVIGVAVLLQGIFACVFFLVVASIAENIIVIRKNTMPKVEVEKK